MAWTRPRAPSVDEILTNEALNDYSANLTDLRSAYAAIVYRASAQTLTTGVLTSILYDTEELDSGGYHSTVSSTEYLSVPAGFEGWAWLYVGGEFVANATGNRYLLLYEAGSGRQLDVDQGLGKTGHPTHLESQAMVRVTGGEGFAALAQQDSGGNLNWSGGRNFPFVMVLFPDRDRASDGAWIPHGTWATGDTPNAAELAQVLRDNVNHLAGLHTPVFARAYIDKAIVYDGSTVTSRRSVPYNTPTDDDHGLLGNGIFTVPDLGGAELEAFVWGRVALDPSAASASTSTSQKLAVYHNPPEPPDHIIDSTGTNDQDSSTWWLWNWNGTLRGHSFCHVTVAPGDTFVVGTLFSGAAEPSTSGYTLYTDSVYNNNAFMFVRPRRAAAISETWTTPLSWSGVPTATQLNQQFNDNQAYLREVVCHATGVHNTTASGNVTGGTPAALTIADPATNDPDNYWASGTPTRLTVPSGLAGIYLIRGAVEPAPLNDTTDAWVRVQFRKNGATIVGTHVRASLLGSAFDHTTAGLAFAALAAGDYIEIMADHSDTGVARATSAVNLTMTLIQPT